MDELHVATLNIRNLADRWSERLGLLLADMSALQPDLLGLQEVVYPMQQDRLIGAAGEGSYDALRAGPAGPSTATACSSARRSRRRRSTGSSSGSIARPCGRPWACRAGVACSWSSPTSTTRSTARRSATSRPGSCWPGSTAAPSADAQVVMGDFNANPAEPAAERMRSAGFRSAYADANGHEPAVTWPSGLQAPAIDTDGDPACLDYIWIRGAARVTSARLTFDRPDPEDLTLFPSDHFGIATRLEIG